MRIPVFSAGVLVWTGLASAQCAEWTRLFDGPGLGQTKFSSVLAMAEFRGELYAGGSFLRDDQFPLNNVARWDGSSWNPLSSGLARNGTWLGVSVYDMAVFDDGGGQDLYVVGQFEAAGGVTASSIARWDGAQWSAVTGPFGEGLDGTGLALAVYDDGTGPALFVGGDFTTAGGLPASYVARWDGFDWSAPPAGPDDLVLAMTTYDDGTGNKLVVSAPSFNAGSISRVAAWDGALWTPLGAGLSDRVEDLAVFDDGAGPVLFAAGLFGTAPDRHQLARWDGTTWTMIGPNSAFGGGFGGDALAVYDDGAGPALFVGGFLKSAAGTQNALGLGRWDGSTWSLVPDVLPLLALQVHDDGSGPRLTVGGQFQGLGSGGDVPAVNVGQWDGLDWYSMGTGPGGLDDTSTALVEFDDGAGPALYVGGEFLHAGGAPASHIARFDGTAWSAVGEGFDKGVNALATFDDGNGVGLYAAGRFTGSGAQPINRIARWSGAAWEPLGAGLDDWASSLVVHDDGSGPALYAGGLFDLAGGISAPGVARWDGAWSAVGTGLGDVFALASYDDGSGPVLAAAGVSGVQVWDGGSWSPLGSPTLAAVSTLVAHDDGTGMALYAGGDFASLGGAPANNVARWDGTGWTQVGNGLFIPAQLNGAVHGLAVFDDGTGPRLYAGGYFEVEGNPERCNFARWDGTVWEPVACTEKAIESDLVVYDGSLHLAGRFTSVDGETAVYQTEFIAAWGPGCTCGPKTYCTAGTTTNGCVPAISALGLASRSFATGFSVSVSDVEGAKLGFLFFGVTGPKVAPWGTGTSFACVQGPHVRTPPQVSGGTAGTCDGDFTLDFNTWMAANPLRAPAPGATAWMQAYFRDPPAPKTTNLSDALELYVCP